MKTRKKISMVLLICFLLNIFSLNYMVKAENLNNLPEINFAVQANYPLYVGDKQSVYVNSNYEGLVQYRAFLKEGDGTWSEVTDGYSEPVDGKEAFKIESNKEYKAGDNYFVVWVKRANVNDELILHHDETIKETEIPQLGGHKKIYDDVYSFKMTAIDKEGKTDIDEVDIKVDGLNVSVEGSDYYAIQALNVDESWEQKVEFTKNNASREFKPGRYLIDLWADKDGNGYPDAYRLEYFELKEKESEDKIEKEIFTTQFNNLPVGGETIVTLTEDGKKIYPDAAKYSIEAYFNDNLVVLTKISLLNEAAFTLAGQNGLEIIVKLYTEDDALITSIPVKLGEKGKVIQLEDEEIAEDDFVYGTEDIQVINKNIYVKGNNVILKNLNILGKLVIDPGENGTTNIQNVNVDTIEILSGDVKSIHFNNVKANNLSINSETNVKVILKENTTIGRTLINSSAILENQKGDFGKIYIEKGEEKVVKLKGNFGKIEVLSSVDLRLEDANIEKIISQCDYKLEISEDSQIGILDIGENKVEVIGNEDNIKQKIDSNGIVEDNNNQNQNNNNNNNSGNSGSKPAKHVIKVEILNGEEIKLEVEKTITLEAKVHYSNGTTSSKVTWESSDSSIAEVNNGVVTAKKAGTVTITASKDGKSDTCIVEVTEKPVEIKVTKVEIMNEEKIEIEEGETVELEATVYYSDGTTSSEVTWESSDISIAEVNNGVVTGKKAGTVTIIASKDGKSDTCIIEVTEKPVETKVTKVEIMNEEKIEIEEGETVELEATVYYSDGTTSSEVTWESSDNSIAEVNNGVVTGKKAGTVTIIASKDGKSDTCIVEVVIASQQKDYEIIVNENDVQITVYNTLAKKTSISLFNSKTNSLKFFDVKPESKKFEQIYTVKTHLEDGSYYGYIYVGGETYNIESLLVGENMEKNYEVNIDGNDVQIIVYNTLYKKVSISLFESETNNLKFYDIKPEDQIDKETYKVSTYLKNGEYYGNIYLDGNSYSISSFKVE